MCEVVKYEVLLDWAQLRHVCLMEWEVSRARAEVLKLFVSSSGL